MDFTYSEAFCKNKFIFPKCFEEIGNNSILDKQIRSSEMFKKNHERKETEAQRRFKIENRDQTPKSLSVSGLVKSSCRV